MSREALLRRAVTISLFSWRRAAADDALDDADRQGWWGDCAPTEAGDQIGSRLWLLRRRALTDEALRDAQEYAEEALHWMIDDDIVTTVAVTAERQGNDRLNLLVTLTESNGETVQLAFEDTWSLINAV